MDQLPPEQTFFAVGGTLALDAPSYLARKADSELTQCLLEGDYCYLLNSRQMGKSSLCVRAKQTLEAKGIRVAFLDLTKFGGRNITAEQWYVSLLAEISRAIGRRTEALAAFKSGDGGPMRRFFDALESACIDEPLCILVDEIDVTRSLPFDTDEFFAGVRECFNRRVQEPRLQNLTFALIGVATPSELVRDARTTPFNIGRRIELRDFTESEAMPLASGLGMGGEKKLRRILHWTGGHPYLTQAVCAEAVAHPSESIDAIVNRMFFTAKARETNVNLADVQNRMLSVPPEGVSLEEHRAAILDLYAQVRSRRKSVKDDETGPLVALLKLCGLTRVIDGYLWIRNRIYFRVFDQAWVRAQMPNAELERQKRAVRIATLRTGLVTGALTIVFAALAINNSILAKKNAELAGEKDSALADVSSQKKSLEALSAERLASIQEAQRLYRVALTSRAEALKKGRIAENARRKEQLSSSKLAQLVREQRSVTDALPSERVRSARALVEQAVSTRNPELLARARAACELAMNASLENQDLLTSAALSAEMARMELTVGRYQASEKVAMRAVQLARAVGDVQSLYLACETGAMAAKRRNDQRAELDWISGKYLGMVGDEPASKRISGRAGALREAIELSQTLGRLGMQNRLVLESKRRDANYPGMPPLQYGVKPGAVTRLTSDVWNQPWAKAKIASIDFDGASPMEALRLLAREYEVSFLAPDMEAIGSLTVSAKNITVGEVISRILDELNATASIQNRLLVIERDSNRSIPPIEFCGDSIQSLVDLVSPFSSKSINVDREIGQERVTFSFEGGSAEELLAMLSRRAKCSYQSSPQGLVISAALDQAQYPPLAALGKPVDIRFRAVMDGEGVNCMPGLGADVPRTDRDRELLSEIARWVGTPYVWGGTRLEGADSSGFVQTVMRKFDIELPRNSQDMARKRGSRLIGRGTLEFGDLIVSTNPKSVMIYVGSGKVAELRPGGEIFRELGERERVFVVRVWKH